MGTAPDASPGSDFLGSSDPVFWQASHIAYSIDMVSSLPRLRDGVSDDRVFLACTEAWLLHYRLLAEFLSPSPHNLKRDVTSETFGWTGLDQTDRAYLEDRKDLASKYLVHLSAQRFPGTHEELEYHPVTRDDMVRANARLIEMIDHFVMYLREQKSPVHDFLRHVVDAARSN